MSYDLSERRYIKHDYKLWKEATRDEVGTTTRQRLGPIELMSFRLLPGVNRRAARQIVKDQIHPRQHFRQQDNLSGVH